MLISTKIKNYNFTVAVGAIESGSVCEVIRGRSEIQDSVETVSYTHLDVYKRQGLFSGVSVLSLIEIIYYITLRFYTNVRYHKESSEDGNAENNCHPDIFRVDSNNEKKVAIE